MSLPPGQSARAAADARTDHENFHRQFGNIFDDDMPVSAALVQPVTGETDYFCVFCDQRDFSGREDVRRHYQHHLEYYPILCSLCGSRATDLPDFLKHHTTCHPGCEKGKYKRRELPHVDRWLSGFLYAQSTIVTAFPPREQCPVCDKVFSAEQIAGARPRRCTINRKIDHVHRHLCYLPYTCVKCRDEDGKEFLVAYFESKAHSHIKLKHPDVDDQQSRWFVFQKTIAIPKLDNFVAGYLNRFGISMDLERRPVRKSLLSDPSQAPLSGSDSDDDDMDEADDSFPSGDVPSTSDPARHLLSLAHGSHLSVPPNGSDEIIIPVSPELVDLDFFDAGSLGLRAEPFTPYFCIFCPEKLDSPSRAHVHFGAHFDYHPIICLICEQRFNDIDSFSTHHKSMHEAHSDLKFEVREDFMIEKWIDDFLKFQKSLLINKLLLSCSCAKFCPCCSKINANTMASITCLSHNEAFFADHLNHHMNYLPYVCLICKRNGKLVRITNLAVSGASHIHKEHANADPEILTRSVKLFSKVLCIPKIDEIIKSNIVTRQALFADTSLQPVSETRHLRIHIPSANPVQRGPVSVHQKSNRMDAMANMRVITQGNRMILKQFQPKPPKSISKSIPQPQLGPNHVRIEGGRVVNLPEARITHTQPVNSTHFRVAPMPRTRTGTEAAGKWQPAGRTCEKVIGHHRVLQPHVQKPHLQSGQSLIASSALAAVPVTCLHCNKLYPSKRLLRLHSNKFHPGLQVTFATASSGTR